LAAAGRATDTAVIVALRAVSLAGAAAAIALTAALAWRLGGRVAALTAALAMAAMGEVAEWGVTAHPDTVQLGLVAATLLAATMLAERNTTRRVVLCGALAGLVFGTKYLGVLLLPLLLFAAVVGRARVTGRWPEWRSTARDAVLLCLC